MIRYLPSIEDADNEVTSAIRAEHARELNAVYAALDEILRGLSDFGAKQGKPKDDLESARLFLATRSFNSLYSAVRMLERGYFQQSLSLVRMAKEDQLVARDAEHNSPTLDALLHGRGRIGSGSLSFARMAERLSPKTKEAWDEDYGFLSEHGVHTRLKGLRSLVASGPDGRPVLPPGGQYDKVWVNAALYYTLRELVQTFATVAQLTVPAEVDWITGAMPAFEEVDTLWRRIDEWAAGELRESAEKCDQIPDKSVERM